MVAPFLYNVKDIELRVDVPKSTPLYWKLAAGMKAALGSFCVQDYAEEDEGWIIKRCAQPRTASCGAWVAVALACRASASGL